VAAGVVATATTAANQAIFLVIAPSLAVVEADSEVAAVAVAVTATTAANPVISLGIALSPGPVADVAALIGNVTSAKVTATFPAIAPPNCHVERVFSSVIFIPFLENEVLYSRLDDV